MDNREMISLDSISLECPKDFHIREEIIKEALMEEDLVVMEWEATVSVFIEIS
jgi:hypothetical protein